MSCRPFISFLKSLEPMFFGSVALRLAFLNAVKHHHHDDRARRGVGRRTICLSDTRNYLECRYEGYRAD